MAIYQATLLEPRNTAIDVTEANNFTCQANGTSITRYILRIFPIAGGGAVYTDDTTLSPALGDTDTLTIVVPANSGTPTLTNGNQYKWSIETFENTTSIVSDEVAFIANANPVIGFTVPATITTQTHVFTPTYTQADDVAIQVSYFIFRNADGSELLRTDDNFTGNLGYTFEGLLSGLSYSVQFFGITQNGVAFNTAIINFAVLYAQPNINIQPTVTQDRNTSITTVSWGSVVVIPGTSVGTVDFIEDYLVDGNTGIDLSDGASITWDVDVPEVFTAQRVWQREPDFTTGTAITLLGDTKNYTVGYDGTRWTFSNGASQGFSEVIALSDNPLIIYVRSTDAYIWDNTTQILTRIQTQ